MQEKRDFDEIWKSAVKFFFEEFMELLLPKIHKKIDYSKPINFLDKELERLHLQDPDKKTTQIFL